MKETIVVWFSCGAASAVALQQTIERYGKTHIVRAVNNPVKEEHPDNQRFLRDVEKWLNIEVETCTNPDYPNHSCVEVWEDRQYMSGVAGAPCTMELKKRARQHWENNNHFDHLVLGFTLDEKARAERFKFTERSNVLDVLIDAELTKDDCFQIIADADIRLPEMYFLGYPNANCIGCVKSSSPAYWNHVRKVHPAEFLVRAKQSRKIGCKLVICHPKYLPFCSKINGEWYDTRTNTCLHVESKGGKRKLKSPRIFLDELPSTVRAGKLKGMNIECGIFCEEKVL